MSPSRLLPGSARGYIVPIGGAEDKLRNRNILRRFVAVCDQARTARLAQRLEDSFAGGLPGDRSRANGHIAEGHVADDHAANGLMTRAAVDATGQGIHLAIIPTASELADTGSRYAALFRDLGVARVTVLPFERRSDGGRRDWLETLGGVDGIFLTGGNQLRLSTTLGGTMVAQLLRRLNADGRAGGRHLGRRRVPERAHDRLRRARAPRRAATWSPWRRGSASPTASSSTSTSGSATGWAAC